MKKHPLLFEILLVLSLLIAGTVILYLFNADLRLQSIFYDAQRGWFMGESSPWKQLYHFGNIPAILVLFGSVMVLILGFWIVSFRKYRKIALFFMLVLVVGPGIFVNMVFKDHWGRPRPRDIVEFGGKMDYCQVWEIGMPGKGKSFPCGHASVGFFLLAPFFLLRKNHQILSLFFLFLGLSYGTLMGIGRMIQGGHFASDVLWSAGIVYLSALGAYRLLGLHRQLYLEEERKSSRKGRGLVTGISLAAAGLVFAGLLLATPNHSTGERKIPTTQKWSFDLGKADVNLVQKDGLFWETDGFGWPKSRMEVLMATRGTETSISFKRKGFFTELNHKVSIGMGQTAVSVLKVDEGNIVLDASLLPANHYSEIWLGKGDLTLQVNEGSSVRLLTSLELEDAGKGRIGYVRDGTGYIIGKGQGPVIRIMQGKGRIFLASSGN